MELSDDRLWSAEPAFGWYRARPWVCGFNYVPSSALNSTEMWQRSTFDLATIVRELGWAAEIGLNSCRVFVQYLVWQDDPEGMLDRLDRFLDVADHYGISTVPILFDDCAFAGKQPYLGPQDAPDPGVHNSGWTPSPGHERVIDRQAWPDLERYVAALVQRFGDDERVLAWDLYNEPGNGGMGDKGMPLLREVFTWARRYSPGQPLTAAVWRATTQCSIRA